MSIGPESEHGRPGWERWLRWAAIALLAWLGEEHLRGTITYSVDIPNEDDWNLFTNGLGPDLDWGWVFSRHNEHRMVATRLLVWVLYRLDGWNLTVNHFVNAGLYAAIVFATIVLLRRATHDRPLWLPWLAACFLLPGVVAINVLFGIQSCNHFTVLFTLLAALALFSPEPSLMRVAAGSMASVAAAYSFSSGVAASAVLAGTFTLASLAAATDAGGQARKRAVRIMVVIGVHAIGLGAYLASYVRGGYPKVWPYRAEFWSYYAELVSSGFGLRHPNQPLAMLFLAFALAGGLVWLWRARLRMTSAQWGLVAAWAASASALAVITVGRASLGGLELAKSERYVEMASVMVPLSLGLWQLVLENRSVRVRVAFWVTSVAVLLGFFAPGLLVEPHYRALNRRFVSGAACVDSYLRHPTGDGWCREIYPWAPLPPHLQLARELRLSFTRRH